MPDRDFLRNLLGGGSSADEILLDPRVEAAARRTSAIAFYEALRKVRATAKSTDVRMALDEALSRRRSFADPIGKAPTMSTINGVGTRLYGRSDTDADGTY